MEGHSAPRTVRSIALAGAPQRPRFAEGCPAGHTRHGEEGGNDSACCVTAGRLAISAQQLWFGSLALVCWWSVGNLARRWRKPASDANELRGHARSKPGAAFKRLLGIPSVLQAASASKPATFPRVNASRGTYTQSYSTPSTSGGPGSGISPPGGSTRQPRGRSRRRGRRRRSSARSKRF